jgi:hypothetical protein
MSYSSLLNNPLYSGLFSNANLNSFVKSTAVQSYLNNNPTTIYTLKNLYQTAPGSGISRNLVANDGATTKSDPVLFNAGAGTATITVPAGTYTLNMKIRINIQDAVGPATNMTYGELVVFNASDPTVFTTKIAVSSSASFVQSVASALTFVDINDTQRIVLATATTLSMIYQYSNSVGTHAVVYGISDGIDYTTIMTLQPTI